MSSSVSDAPREYVAYHFSANASPPERFISNMNEAKSLMHDYLIKRISAVLETLPGQPCVLLSGGVDSVLNAASLQSLGSSPLCLTIAVEGLPSSDRDGAELVARSMGLRQETLALTTDELRGLIETVSSDLDCRELWELSAGIPFRAAFKHLDKLGIDEGAVFTGGGADVLLAGGQWLPEGPHRVDELTSIIWEKVGTSFTYWRRVPDFYERVLGTSAPRLIHLFQTVAAWDSTKHLGPDVLFERREVDGNAAFFDKAVLRHLAVDLGVPSDLAWTPKLPMQVASGIIGGIVFLAREAVSELPDAGLHDDPMTEPIEHSLARLYLSDGRQDKSDSLS